MSIQPSQGSMADIKRKKKDMTKFKKGDLVKIVRMYNARGEPITSTADGDFLKGHIARVKRIMHGGYELEFLSIKTEAVWNWIDKELEKPTKEEILLAGL